MRGGKFLLHWFQKISPYILTGLLLASIHASYRQLIWTFYFPKIILITPTHKRAERLADMTRLAQTLSQVKYLNWIVIEDGNQTVPSVQRILDRSGIPNVYFFAKTEPGLPKRGWTHRNQALSYVRSNYRTYGRPAVLYFADDDNTYDVRLFGKYIRKVETIGIWAVGLVGGALVEAPRISNRSIVGWNVVYAPNRKFAVDMAGFAINLKLILTSTSLFHKGCTRRTAESCFLQQFGIPKERMQAFGHNDHPRELLVWHTKTRASSTQGARHGYDIE